MTPDDIRLIEADVAAIEPEPFAAAFYRTLFEIAPEVRSLFPDDMAEQRRKLMAELTAMIAMATSMADGDLDRFVDRTRRLGARHVGYGASPAHYDVVGRALLSTLATETDGWGTDHESAWTRLYTVVAATMQEGARMR